MSDRDLILAALGEGAPLPDAPPTFVPAPKTLGWETFAERLTALGGRLVERDALAALAGKRAWVDPDAETLAAGLGLERAEIWEAEVGVTLAELAVAESGSLLLAAGPGRRRMGSLAPEIHVAFVREEALVSTLEEALARLSGRTSVLITGSSRTADIEGVLVRGVHGPKEVWVVRAE